MFTAWQNKGTVFLCLICLIVGVFVGKTFYSKTDVQIIEKPVKITETVKVKGDTTVEYREKEIVKYIKEDGSVGENKEQTDVQADIGQPKVTVKVNNQPYQFSLLQNESQKFEQGKIVLTQNSDISLNLEVKPQIIDKTKRNHIDFFAGKYSGVGIYLNKFGLDVGTNGSETDYRLRYKAVEW